MWSRNKVTTLIFSIIWIMFSIFFFIMGCLSYQSVNTELPRYDCNNTGGASVSLGSMNIEETMRGIAQSHNMAVEKLEKSIRSEARTMTVVNFISAFLCILGFLAQNEYFRNNGFGKDGS